MKALILVGGYGTRLRPLTFTHPKPLIPLHNVPIVFHQIKALASVGVTDVVLAVSFDPKEKGWKDLEKLCEGIKVKVHYSREYKPLGTAGPLKLAEEILCKDGNEIFFVLNSDVTADYPFESLVKMFKEKKCEGCIVGKKVEDPSRFGVIVCDEDYKVERFVEKPKVNVGNLINAGMYILHKDVLKRIKLNVKTSIERDTFPKMAAEGKLFCLKYEEFWMDIGKPLSFIEGQELLFKYGKNKKDSLQKKEKRNYELIDENTVLISENTKIGNGSVIGPNVCIGKNCQIGQCVRLKNCVIMDDVKIHNSAFVDNSMIGWKSVIQGWAKVSEVSILGEDVTVKEGIVLNGVKVCPNKTVDTCFYKGGIVL